MVKKGIKVVVETTIDRIEKRGEALHLHLSDGSVIEADAAMAATGRKPNVENLGLEQVGVATDKAGAVRVDGSSRPSVEATSVVGAVTHRLNPTPDIGRPPRRERVWQSGRNWVVPGSFNRTEAQEEKK